MCVDESTYYYCATETYDEAQSTAVRVLLIVFSAVAVVMGVVVFYGVLCGRMWRRKKAKKQLSGGN